MTILRMTPEQPIHDFYFRIAIKLAVLWLDKDSHKQNAKPPLLFRSVRDCFQFLQNAYVIQVCRRLDWTTVSMVSGRIINNIITGMRNLAKLDEAKSNQANWLTVCRWEHLKWLIWHSLSSAYLSVIAVNFYCWLCKSHRSSKTKHIKKGFRIWSSVLEVRGMIWYENE